MNSLLLILPPPIVKISIKLSLVCVLVGLLPLSCIALHVLGMLPLSESALMLALPGYFVLVVIGLINPSIGKLVLRGWFIGLVAVALYDCSRIPFIFAGWNDFVPHIGDWLFEQQGSNQLIGYFWRYAGNGGGLGITFLFLMQLFKKPQPTIWPGIIFGLLVFSCLMLTLLIAPQGEALMFEITPFTFMASMIGHIIFGGVLGIYASRGI